MDLSQIQVGIEMGSSSLESMLACTKGQGDRKPRPMEEHALKCPRCDSINTKFCYYNNYSLSQPRYFCKACRRYWTKGGTLRNVPVGGGCRKNKRSSSSPSSFTSMAKRIPDHQPPLSPAKSDACLTVLPSFSCDSGAFSRIQQQSTPHIDELSLFTNRTGVFPRMNVGQSVSPPWWSCHHVDTCSSFGGMGGIEEMMPHLEEERSCSKNSVVTVAAMKHEGCCVGEGEESRLLWGIPWKMIGEGNMGDVNNVGRESWVSLGSSSWHGLLNSTMI